MVVQLLYAYYILYYLLLHNKLAQNAKLKTINMHYLTVSVGQELDRLARWLWLRIS
jgi:hypothetical protein